MPHRSYSTEFKRQVAQDYIAGESLSRLAKRHNLSRNLIHLWVQKLEAGALTEGTVAASTIETSQARIAALERLVGRQAPRDRVSKGGIEELAPSQKRDYVHHHRPSGLSIARGCWLMGIARSTYYDRPAISFDETALVQTMVGIADRFEAYGYRRMQWRCGIAVSL